MKYNLKKFGQITTGCQATAYIIAS